MTQPPGFPQYPYYPPPGPPQYPPPGPPPRRVVSRRMLYAAIGVGASLVLVLGAVVAVLLVGAPSAAATALEPVNTAQANPFMPAPSGTDAAGVTPPQGASGTVGGGTPGLFGGTGNNRTCDREQMIRFLAANPDKGAAWAQAAGIDRDAIPDFLRRLSPVILRSDTAVTNHGYSNGRLTTYQAVLEAGSAVMVDGYGTPRVKCYCGNPLASPSRDVPQQYTGPRWVRFAPVTVIVVRPAPVIIRNITVINIQNNTYVRVTLPPFPYRPVPVPPSSTEPGAPTDSSGPTDLFAPGASVGGPDDPNVLGSTEDTTTTTPTTTTPTDTPTDTTTTTTTTTSAADDPADPLVPN